MNAIMAYLADKYEWLDLYPTNLEERATINQYFNWHHANLRAITKSRFAPLVRLDIPFSEDQISSDYKTAKKAIQNLDDRLSKSTFLCGDTLSLADFAASGELIQTIEEYCNFAKLPINILRWIEEMKKIPFFEKMHMTLGKFGQKVFQKNMLKSGRSKL